MAVAVSSTDAKSLVEKDVQIIGSNVTVDSRAKIKSQGKATTKVFRDGTASVGVGVNYDVTDVTAQVNGSITANNTQVSNETDVSPTAFDSLTDALQIMNHGLSTGDLVTYAIGESDTAIEGLNPGQQYFVLKVDDNNLQLTRQEALDVHNRGVNSGSTQTLSPWAFEVFDPLTQIDGSDNQTFLIDNHPFTHGQEIRYDVAAGTELGDLSNLATYVVNVVNVNSFQLVDSDLDLPASSGAKTSNAIDITPPDDLDEVTPTADQVFTYIDTANAASFDPETDVDSDTDIFTVVGHGLQTGEEVFYDTDSSVDTMEDVRYNALFDATADTVFLNTDADVDKRNSIVITRTGQAEADRLGHGLLNDDMVTYEVEESGTPIAGLTPGDTYKVVLVDEFSIKLVDSDDNDVVITSVGSGLHNFYQTRQTAAGDTPLGGLTAAESYFVSVIDADTFRLTESSADAFAAAPVQLTAAGSGSGHKLVHGTTGLTVTADLNATDNASITGNARSKPYYGDMLSSRQHCDRWCAGWRQRVLEPWQRRQAGRFYRWQYQDDRCRRKRAKQQDQYFE